MDKRRISDEYNEIAQALIDERPELAHIKENEISIICLASEHKKKSGDKLILGQCEKIAEKYKWGIPCDFTITIFEPNVAGLSDEQLKIVIFHELLHVGVDDDRLYIVPHDLEDFKLIISEFGIDWSKPAAS